MISVAVPMMIVMIGRFRGIVATDKVGGSLLNLHLGIPLLSKKGASAEGRNNTVYGNAREFEGLPAEHHGFEIQGMGWQ